MKEFLAMLVMFSDLTIEGTGNQKILRKNLLYLNLVSLNKEKISNYDERLILELSTVLLKDMKKHTLGHSKKSFDLTKPEYKKSKFFIEELYTNYVEEFKFYKGLKFFEDLPIIDEQEKLTDTGFVFIFSLFMDVKYLNLLLGKMRLDDITREFFMFRRYTFDNRITNLKAIRNLYLKQDLKELARGTNKDYEVLTTMTKALIYLLRDENETSKDQIHILARYNKPIYIRNMKHFIDIRKTRIEKSMLFYKNEIFIKNGNNLPFEFVVDLRSFEVEAKIDGHKTALENTEANKILQFILGYSVRIDSKQILARAFVNGQSMDFYLNFSTLADIMNANDGKQIKENLVRILNKMRKEISTNIEHANFTKSIDDNKDAKMKEKYSNFLNGRISAIRSLLDGKTKQFNDDTLRVLQKLIFEEVYEDYSSNKRALFKGSSKYFNSLLATLEKQDYKSYREEIKNKVEEYKLYVNDNFKEFLHILEKVKYKDEFIHLTSTYLITEYERKIEAVETHSLKQLGLQDPYTKRFIDVNYNDNKSTLSMDNYIGAYKVEDKEAKKQLLKSLIVRYNDNYDRIFNYIEHIDAKLSNGFEVVETVTNLEKMPYLSTGRTFYRRLSALFSYLNSDNKIITIEKIYEALYEYSEHVKSIYKDMFLIEKDIIRDRRIKLEEIGTMSFEDFENIYPNYLKVKEYRDKLIGLKFLTLSEAIILKKELNSKKQDRFDASKFVMW